jgi:hypothetical protein
MVKSGSSITFYPCIEMKYDAFTVTDQPIYVMGIYERTITQNAVKHLYDNLLFEKMGKVK